MSDYPLTSTWAEVDAAAQAVKNGLPKANLSGAVQASLDKADGAVQVGDQATKTSSMTQAVGVDLQGKLWTAPGGGGGGDAEVFWITITASGGSYVMDCTWADIADAMSNGMLIVAKIGDRRYWWNGDPTDDGLQLVRVYVSSSSKAYAEAFIISDGGTIARTSNVSLNPSDLWLNTLSLPSSEKEKARNNIGAGDYSIPSGGIPESDLASAVQNKLPLRVTISWNGSIFSSDKTFSEVSAAEAAGHPIDVAIDNMYGWFGGITNDTATFFAIEKNAGGAPSLYAFELTASGVSSTMKTLGDEIAPTKTTVSGSTPSIAAAANTVYTCGELTSLTISSVPAVGEFSVIFTSGSTATTVSLPATLKMPSYTIEANMIYELNVMDGRGLLAGWSST